MLNAAVEIKGEFMGDHGTLSDVDLIVGNGPGGNSYSPAYKDLDLGKEFQANPIGIPSQNEIAPPSGDGGDLISGSGPGGTPRVKVYNGMNGAFLNSFYEFCGGFSGEIRIASDFITSSDCGGDSRIF